jgi:uncharacterized protein YndB with AHSA1/START domain
MEGRTDTAEPTIAEDAPVASAAEGLIDAPIDRVWAVLTTIDEWPAWNPDVRSASLHGPVAEGSTFRWQAGPGTITSHIEHVDRPRLIAWTGRTLGIRAVHVWRLEEQDGRTRVRSEESYDGLVARLLRRRLQTMLDTALADGVRHLDAEAVRDGAAGR